MNSVNIRPSGQLRPRRAATIVVALLSMTLVGAACGGDSESVSPPTTTAAAETTAAETVPTTVATVPETVVSAIPEDSAPDMTVTEEATEVTMLATPEYTEYVTITDDSGKLTVEVPVEWADIDATAVESFGLLWPRVEASPDLDEFDAAFAVPGVRFLAVPATGGTLDDMVEAFAVGGCTAGELKDYDDSVFVGRYQLYTQCDGTAAAYLVLAADLVSGADARYVVVVQAVTSADLVALDRILESFNAVA